ncbi:MAG: PKD domain-containing protein [Thermoplasmatota archaeon]
MRPGTALICSIAIIASLTATLAPLAGPRSDNPCAECHGPGYWQYLDILEGDPEELIPESLSGPGPFTVRVALRNDCSHSLYGTMSDVTATLLSRDGMFSVAVPTLTIGELSRGERVLASWEIYPKGSGSDALLISAEGRNNHFECRFTDSYSPVPEVFVERPAANQPPSISLEAIPPGSRLSGGSTLTVKWSCWDESIPECTVALEYSTDGFEASIEKIGSVQASAGRCDWLLPPIDSGTVLIRAVITDREGLSSLSEPVGPLAIDSTPPYIVEVEPREGEVGVSANALITIRFSEPVVRATAELAFSMIPSPGAPAWSWTPDGTMMSASLGPLAPETLYECEMGTEVRDTSEPGNTMVRPRAWSFTTGSNLTGELEIDLLSPSGGERLYWGDGIDVVWAARGGSGGLVVSLALSVNGSSGPFTVLAEGLPAIGNLTLPAPEVESNSCAICATVRDGSGLEAGALSPPLLIARPMCVTAVLPSGGEVIQEGDVVDISWRVVGGHGSVSVGIGLLPSPGAREVAVASGLPPQGAYRWTAPNLSAERVRLVVRAVDDWGGSAELLSPEFIISPRPPPPPPPNRPPVASFFIEGGMALRSTPVALNASASRDPDGDEIHFLWVFGDGSSPRNTTEPIVAHIYERAGSYSVVLTVDDGRSAASQSILLRVESPGPVGAPGSDWFIGAPGALILILGAVGVIYAAAFDGRGEGRRDRKGVLPEASGGERSGGRRGRRKKGQGRGNRAGDRAGAEAGENAPTELGGDRGESTARTGDGPRGGP